MATKIKPPNQKSAAVPEHVLKRRGIIQKIEAERGSKLVTYITSTRAGLESQMAPDAIRYFYDHLEEIKKSGSKGAKPKIDLFIHSNGVIQQCHGVLYLS